MATPVIVLHIVLVRAAYRSHPRRIWLSLAQYCRSCSVARGTAYPAGNMFITYAYALDGMAAGRHGVLWLMSTAAQTFEEYEVWYSEGPPLFFGYVHSRRYMSFESSVDLCVNSKRPGTYVFHVDSTRPRCLSRRGSQKQYHSILTRVASMML